MAFYNKHAKSSKSKESIGTALMKLLPEDEETIDGFVVDENESGTKDAALGHQANPIEYFAGEMLIRAYKSVVKDQKDPLLLALGEIASAAVKDNKSPRAYLGKGFGVLAAYALIDYNLRRKKRG